MGSGAGRSAGAGWGVGALDKVPWPLLGQREWLQGTPVSEIPSLVADWARGEAHAPPQVAPVAHAPTLHLTSLHNPLVTFF